MKTQIKELFQITEAATACGLSRSTLMRLEEKGLLTPAYISPDSGRRYYDNHNIARVMQIEKFKSMGLNSKQIMDYFVRGGEASDMLKILEGRLNDLERSVEEMRLRALKTPSVSVQIMTIPSVTCYTRRYMGHTIKEKYNAMYELYSECVRKGYALSDEPLFTISNRQDYLDGYISNEPYPIDVCIPLRADKAPKSTVTLPEYRALSVLYCGDYSGTDEAWLTLGKEAKDRKLKPAAAPRVLGIVAPYTGREIDTSHYCSRFVLPIEE